MSLSQEPVTGPSGTCAMAPDPAKADSLDDLVEQLRRLKVWAGDPSYGTIKDRINSAWTAAGRSANMLTSRSTVADCFQPGRRRVNTELVLAIVEALHADLGYGERWRHALRVVSGQFNAVTPVRVQDTLPPDLAGFAGRTRELDRLRLAAQASDAVAISAIEGMAGVGKTQLAVHAGHLLMREKTFERVLFVNLCGFHSDPGQPPADPGAVLQGFLRLLDMPGAQIPNDLAALTAAYRDRVATAATLVILDNAATAEQVNPLLTTAPGCLTVITSRRSLAELPATTQLTVDVFTPDEALAFLNQAVPDVAVGTDPDAAYRIALRCGYLPLALSLITAHTRNRPGWTLTDHADRLDELHRRRRLDTAVDLALDLSYRHLSGDQQRLLRLAALHPAQDFDPYAAAALTDTDVDTAQAGLTGLCVDHLLQQSGPGRYTFHDLVRAYAVTRSEDEDRPAEHQAALTRLFDHYLATTAAAMNSLHPDTGNGRPKVAPAGTPGPDLSDPDTALTWLETERLSLITVIAHTATRGWPRHTTQLAFTLTSYLTGHGTDALTVYDHAHRAARLNDDPVQQASALKALGVQEISRGRIAPAIGYLEQALDLYRQTNNPIGESRALSHLGSVANQAGRYPKAIDYQQQALALAQQAGDLEGQSHMLTNLGSIIEQLHRYPEAAIDCFRQTLTTARQIGDQTTMAYALHGLGETEMRLGEYASAREHLQECQTLYRQSGFRQGEAGVLNAFGSLHAQLGQFDQATEYYQRALTIWRESGDRYSESVQLNSMGQTALIVGRPGDALVHYTEAGRAADDSGSSVQQAHAHAGLGHAHRALGDVARASEHYQQALALYTVLGLDLQDADQIRTALAELDRDNSGAA
jgi:tetratricopeptide (TPR) repeat protein